MSIDFAKAEHVAKSLLEITWDLLIVDEAHQLTEQRKDVVSQLVRSRKIQRVLLLPVNPLDPNDLHLENLKTTTWKLQPSISAIPKVKAVDYSLSEAELNVIYGLMDLLQQMPEKSQANFTRENL